MKLNLRVGSRARLGWPNRFRTSKPTLLALGRYNTRHRTELNPQQASLRVLFPGKGGLTCSTCWSMSSSTPPGAEQLETTWVRFRVWGSRSYRQICLQKGT